MKTIPIVALLALTVAASACSGPRPSGELSVAVAESARPEIRYYVIADT